MHLPRAMAEAEVVAFFRTIDALEDHTMFLLMLRCASVERMMASPGRPSTWCRAPSRGNSKGQVDRVVYLPPMSRRPCGSGTGSRRRRQAMSSPAVWPASAACRLVPGKSVTG